ncbi:MAG: hypothetical protein GWN55_02500, partial [Phycisphaerae bacterium]|nr:hypothetical protein [Phycisphaerae bacterium]NIU23768.1 hypothetical protein [candidate division KSB1 bacterium]NIV00203.1 hypothetical protein [Phycisphaerae bacterium]NIV68674.1 hypothetical protein [Phycisphaerae bacterium]NIW17607.1 hypothetical protein [candidate division KSB1 bacterium]
EAFACRFTQVDDPCVKSQDTELPNADKGNREYDKQQPKGLDVLDVCLHEMIYG